MDMEGESYDNSDEEWKDYDDGDSGSSGDNEEDEWHRMYRNAPEVTLSSLTEANGEESAIPVLNQRSYTGKGVIPSALANILCTDLGVDGVLEMLNTTLGTSHTLDESVISILNVYVAQGFDFGTAYAYFRVSCGYIPEIKFVLRGEEEDRETRRKVLDNDRITRRDVPPRRVWDLYANRVMPYWVAHQRPWGISHAWVDEKDRVNVMTPINGYEWPVPMPKDASLDLIRIEMLNMMLEDFRRRNGGYIWLDVLCLRQEGGKGEHRRLDEWKLDVPTIGHMYGSLSEVVCYFNGLGRPLHKTLCDFESDRSWFRRAWTLQEIPFHDPIIGGETGDDDMEQDTRRRFDQQLASLGEISLGKALNLVSEMRHRVSTKPLDKVAGLIYHLSPFSIPIYDTEQQEADAWDVLVDAISSWHRGEFLFFYPEPGDRRKCWRPSWEQVMTSKYLVCHDDGWSAFVLRTNDPDAEYYASYYIELGNVRGLSEVPEEPKHRQGELLLSDATGAPHTLKVVAEHIYPIPNGLYTLLGSSRGDIAPDLWVIGKLREDGKFEKLSVFRSANDEQVRLEELGLDEEVKTFLC